MSPPADADPLDVAVELEAAPDGGCTEDLEDDPPQAATAIVKTSATATKYRRGITRA
ncbi:MAG: hypothetical protein NVS3B21_15770 [Acidimicrobiales bacterium]